MASSGEDVFRTAALDPTDLAASGAALVELWRDALVVTVKPTAPLADVRATYDAFLPRIGTPHHLAEDATIADRDQQRTGELWFEVRYDPAVEGSYRHSRNA